MNLENQKSVRKKTIYSIDEALDALYQNQVARQTFVRQMQMEHWPTVMVMKRIFIPAKFIEGKLAQMEALADAALAAEVKESAVIN